MARTIDGERVLLDRENNLVHKLNPTASLVWDLCDGATGVDAICERLAEEFDSPAAEIAADVRTLIARLAELGLLDRGVADS